MTQKIFSWYGTKLHMHEYFYIGVETFKKTLDDGQAGDQVGALVRGMKRDDVKRGMVLCAPGTVTPHTKILSQVRYDIHIHSS